MAQQGGNELSFTDNFSKQASIYVKYRPQYPDALFAYVASLAGEHKSVWDCGTGNGQAAVGLVAYFDTVIATDPSSDQIANAMRHERVEYRTEPAEHSSLAAHSVDVVTVATALHWFKLDAFYAEVRRVLRPGGILAAWAYGTPSITPEVDAVVMHLHNDILGSYWQYENRLVEQEYRTLPFPFDEMESPVFYTEKEIVFNDLIGYLNTWSAVQKFIADKGYDPVVTVHDALLQAWGKEDERRVMRWKLVLKVARVGQNVPKEPGI